MADARVTIKIPRVIYERVQKVIEGSGFSSVTDFVVYVLRDLVSERNLREGGHVRDAEDSLTRDEIRAVRRRLRSLGYLE